MLAGELHRCTLDMRNAGTLPLQGIKLLISHPDVHCPASNAELQADNAEVAGGEAAIISCVCMRHLLISSSLNCNRLSQAAFFRICW